MLVGNIMLDASGQITQWNARAQRLFSFPADKMLGRSFACLVAESGFDGAGLLAGAATAGYVDYTADCVRADGSDFPARILVTVLQEDERARGYSLVVQNISDRSAAQQQREDGDARLTGIIQAAMDAIITVDEEQRIILFNTAAERIFLCPAEKAMGSPLDLFIPQRYRAMHRGHIERFSATGVTMRRMGDRMVLRGLRGDGEEFPIDASISQVTVEGRRLFTVILRDVTYRQQAAEALESSHAQLRALYESMHEVREAERTRIARELHDETAQWLTALKMDAAWIASHLPPGQDALPARLEKMKLAVDTAVASVRRIAADLRPVMLDDLGLASAVEHLVHDFSERTGIAATLEADTGDLEVQEPHATALYRMIQEALTNVSRHAGASGVEAALRFREGTFVAYVRDNGRGVTAEDLRTTKSFGILGIRERAQTLGGSAEIFSPPEGGTVVEIRVPLDIRDAAGAGR